MEICPKIGGDSNKPMTYDVFEVATEVNAKKDPQIIAVFLNDVGEEGLELYNTFTLTDEQKLVYEKRLRISVAQRKK